MIREDYLKLPRSIISEVRHLHLIFTVESIRLTCEQSPNPKPSAHKSVTPRHDFGHIISLSHD